MAALSRRSHVDRCCPQSRQGDALAGARMTLARNPGIDYPTFMEPSELALQTGIMG